MIQIGQARPIGAVLIDGLVHYEAFESDAKKWVSSQKRALKNAPAEAVKVIEYVARNFSYASALWVLKETEEAFSYTYYTSSSSGGDWNPTTGQFGTTTTSSTVVYSPLAQRQILRIFKDARVDVVRDALKASIYYETWEDRRTGGQIRTIPIPTEDLPLPPEGDADRQLFAAAKDDLTTEQHLLFPLRFFGHKFGEAEARQIVSVAKKAFVTQHYKQSVVAYFTEHFPNSTNWATEKLEDSSCILM